MEGHGVLHEVGRSKKEGIEMISVVLNCDTRPVSLAFQGLHKGVRSRDFLRTAGLLNKRNFFKGHEIELIVFVDEHEPLTAEEYYDLHTHADCVVIRKHSKYYRGANPFSAFNDVNYLHALSMVRGEHVAHFDMDMAAFSADGSVADWMLGMLESGMHKFISYPSVNAPAPCHAPEYLDKWWASTRFFMCKRETLDFTVLERAIRDPQWFYSTYDRPPRENPWTEQFLGIMGDYQVLYPLPSLESWAVFPWMNYRDGALEKLNSMTHDQVAAAIHRAGGAGTFYDGVDVNLMGVI